MPRAELLLRLLLAEFLGYAKPRLISMRAVRARVDPQMIFRVVQDVKVRRNAPQVTTRSALTRHREEY